MTIHFFFIWVPLAVFIVFHGFKRHCSAVQPGVHGALSTPYPPLFAKIRCVYYTAAAAAAACQAFFYKFLL
jgi:hypothetical protein